MSLNGLVRPNRPKCQSLNWSWIRAHQLAPQGLGPIMDPIRRCDYGNTAPYIDPTVYNKLDKLTPYRVWGYPNVTKCSRLAPLIYSPEYDKKVVDEYSKQCNCVRDYKQWSYGYYCNYVNGVPVT